jgi:signal transduction histidine kinase/ligand-binding sensor domain-containing protein
MNKSLLFFLTILWLAVLRVQAGGQPENGYPYIKNFTTGDYKAHAQNFGMVSDQKGIIYAANFAGILQYDGINWRLITTGKTTKVSSLAIADSGTVFVGARGEIGYLETLPDGEMEFRSLLPEEIHANPPFQDVFFTCCTPEGTYFISGHDVFRFHDGKTDSWHTDMAVLAGFYLNQTLYLQLKETGLVQFLDRKITPVPGGNLFSGAIEIKAMLPYKQGESLIVTSSQGLFLLGKNGVTSLRTRADEFFRQKIVTSATRLADGDYAFGTTREGIILMKPDGLISRIVDKNAGLLNDYVQNLYADSHNHLWAALNNGISLVEIPSQLTYFDERSGLSGGVTQIERFGQNLVVSTYQGLFFYDETLPGFKPVPGIITACWTMLPFGNELLAATTQGLFLVTGKQTHQINDGFCLSLANSRLDPGAVYVGQTDGLTRIQKHAGRWESSAIQGLSDEIRDLHEDAGGAIWGNSSSQGLFRYAPSYKKTTFFSSEKDVPEANSNSLNLIDGKIVNATRDGIFVFDDQTGAFRLNNFLIQDSNSINPWFTSLIEDKKGNIWTTAGDETSITLYARENNAYTAIRTPFLPVEEVVVWTIFSEPDGKTWFGGPDGLICYNPGIPLANMEIPDPLIRRVTVSNDSLIYAGNMPGGSDSLITNNAVISYNDNSVRFDFAVPYFSVHGDLEFQYKLVGFEDTWSEWTVQYHKEYTNLPKGNFIFQVKARNVYGMVSRPATFSIRILSPWYTEWWAYLLYIILAGSIVYLIVILRNRQLVREKKELEQKIIQRTAEIVQQKEEIEHQSAELANKNDELEKINTLVKSINSEIHFTNLLQSLLEKTKMIKSVERATALILDKETGTFRFKASYGWDIRLLEPVKIDLAHAENRYLKNTEEIYEDIFLKKEFESYNEDADMAALEHPKSMLVLVIKVENKVEAFLILENMGRESAYTHEDLSFIRNSKEHIISAFIKTRILEDLQLTLENLKSTQDQLVQSEKLASLGQLTAGIAHEIQNPLNFVNNFSSLSAELAEELKDILEKIKESITADTYADFDELIQMIKGNVQKIHDHGKRAESIVKGMLQHSRGRSGEFEMADINTMVTEYVNLAYHGMRAKDKSFNTSLKTSLDPLVGKASIIPQDLSRVILNIVNNACYAVDEKAKKGIAGYNPEVLTTTVKKGDKIEIRIRDNGTGIPDHVREKIFNPFFTTKPTGKGTGLGLSMSFDIITQIHKGKLEVLSGEGEFTEFIITIPEQHV